ncbi:carotenoid 9,10(9',10')-cleavage dioxygenase 1-like isoform X1 [Nicotiana tabacum]|uniref:Carotenoid 9,10(9',10')-cleavage dioxygenase 1-like isoform X1 n=2 Tax=Nicotiana TaxID=4085 RepID=A0A1S4CZL9_TOBAC|nr:PREDICTED: carotenoid 9,10(9',10')-cleavage dioxygenase 1-like [Nicotiana sylvestris]XP_016506620.1 PREDICTED: carotenoid 9,10(9',10')-cleavage dioxygenase 1-like isoform X1 [Nicotiana tabacum]
MAFCSYTFQVNCSYQRPSIPSKVQDLKVSISSALNPLSRDLLHFPIVAADIPKAIKETSFKLLDAFVDLVFEFVDQPLLPSQSNFAPVEENGEAVLVTTAEGKIPDDFPEGVYIRNGSNPLFGGLKSTKSIFGKSSHVWIEGEGMLHALYFTKEKGRGTWNIFYNNKHVRTDTFKMEKDRKKPGFLPAIEGDSSAILVAYILNGLRFGMENKYLSNTNIFEHSKKYYSIAENHMPQEIDISSLETLGNWNIDGAWDRPFTSHPKKAPGSGELVIMGIYPRKPYFELGVISADGKKMVHKVDLKFNRCSLCHEIGVTKKYNVIMDFPLTIDINRLFRGDSLIKYDKDGYARIGVMPRYGDANSVKWFEVQPCCVLHLINCFEDNDEVVVRACRAHESVLPRQQSFKSSKEISSIENNNESSEEPFFVHVCEWRLNMRTGEVKEKIATTEFSMEFPMINEKFVGLRNKFGYLQVVDLEACSISEGLAKYGGLAKLHFQEYEELVEVEYHMFPKGTFCSGATFVPKTQGTDENDGWVVTFTHNESTNVSQVYVVDAKNFATQPVAIFTLPSRVPYGFHGAFMPL